MRKTKKTQESSNKTRRQRNGGLTLRERLEEAYAMNEIVQDEVERFTAIRFAEIVLPEKRFVDLLLNGNCKIDWWYLIFNIRSIGKKLQELLHLICGRHGEEAGK